MNYLDELILLRNSYRNVKAALPWLDASVWQGEKTDFPNCAKSLQTPCVPAETISPSQAGQIASIKAGHGNCIFRYNPSISGSLETISPLMPELASARIPLVILHTDMPISEIRDFAKSYPAATFILESGPRKILYFISQVAELLTSCPNVFLSTYNFSNWMGIEQFCQKGFASRLLYGSHWPKYDTGVAMGPIITANIPWEAKCDIAGNNMRRLLGQQAMTTKETPFIPASPFIIDSHCHNIDAGVQSPCNFPLPDEHMSPADWIDFMNRLSIDKIFSTPTLPLYGLDSASHASQKMRKYAPSRFYYYEVFNPNIAAEAERLATDVKKSGCAGIKIHPSQHNVAADSDAYSPVYELAARYNLPILTHSWEISEYNPCQYLSHPDRFRKHLERHKNIHFILGHAGGRPSAIDATTKLCKDFPNVVADLAGDYFHNGVVEAMVERLGNSKVLFASDMNWFDPSCMLGAVLGSSLPDKHVLNILRNNATAFFSVIHK